MTTSSFIPKSSTQFVNWSDPSIWSGGVVPNDPSVDVIIPTTTTVSTGQPYASFLTEDGIYTISSLAISNNYLLLNGTLTLAHNLNISTGGEIDMRSGSLLSVASLDNNGIDIQGSGSINCSGAFLNETLIVGSGLSLTTASLNNPGSLHAASGNLTVTVNPGGFTNLSGSTLTGGTYAAGFSGNQTVNSNTLYLNVGGVIAVDAANISLDGGGAIDLFDSASGIYVPITSSLHFIAASGILSLAHQTYNWSNLTVDGSMALTNATLASPQLTIDPHGVVSGIGTLSAPILNAGAIVAGAPSLGFPTISTNVLDITGPVSGTGLLKIAPALNTTSNPRFPTFLPATLELGAAASSDLVFLDNRGILILDNPSTYSGKIAPTGSGDQVILRGISLNSVTGYSYSGDNNDGTLTVQTTSGSTALGFSGHFDTGNFALSAGPQALSSDPPSLRITNTGKANEPPTITSNGGGDTATLAIAENTTPVTTVIATDPDAGTTLGYTISGGADAGKFAINAATGALSFVTAPDFEAPTDSDGNNSYIVQVRASDGSLFDTQTITVNVTDVFEQTDLNSAPSGDFDGNGRSDLLFRNDNGQIAVWQTSSSGVLTSAVALGSAPASAHIDGTGDFNHDGRGDILFRSDDGTLAVWQTDGQQIQTISVLGSAPSDWHSSGIGDFNGDGTSDLLFRNDNGQIAQWIINNNQIQSIQVLGSTSPAFHVVAISDFNGDGKADLLFRDTAGVLATWILNGNQLQSAQVIGSTSIDWHLVGTGDFNSDGQIDLLWRNNNGQVAEWLMNGAAIQSIQTVGTAGGQYHVEGTGDFNGDGRSDILFRDTGGTVVEWLMNGAAIQTAQVLGSASADFHISAHHFDLM